MSSKESKDGKGRTNMQKVFEKWMLGLVLLASLVSSSLCPSAQAQSGGTQPAATQEAQVTGIEWKRPSDPDSAYASASSGLQVLTGTTVVFRAVKDDNSRAWATGQPHWGGVASGTGAITTVTFNALSSSASDYKTVTVTGAGTDTAKSDVVVYDFSVTSKALEDFLGRSQSHIGLGEQTNLIKNSTPSGVTVPVTWLLTSGPGTVNYSLLTAGTDIGDVIVSAFISSGPSLGMSKSLTVTTVAPSSAHMDIVPGTPVYHVANECSVGVKLNIFLGSPEKVSFSHIQFREEDADPTSMSGGVAPI